jgi:hypothetical protein
LYLLVELQWIYLQNLIHIQHQVWWCSPHSWNASETARTLKRNKENNTINVIMPECHCPESDLAQRVRALVFSARRCCRRSRVRAPVWPGTFLRKNINMNICDPTPRNESLGRILVNWVINMRK